VALTTLGAR